MRSPEGHEDGRQEREVHRRQRGGGQRVGATAAQGRHAQRHQVHGVRDPARQQEAAHHARQEAPETAAALALVVRLLPGGLRLERPGQQPILAAPRENWDVLQ